jgi:hypothetical protein
MYQAAAGTVDEFEPRSNEAQIRTTVQARTKVVKLENYNNMGILEERFQHRNRVIDVTEFREKQPTDDTKRKN